MEYIEMAKKFAVFSAIILLISGCATVSESTPVRVAPISANGSSWLISAKAKTGNIYDDVTLFVNGQQAAHGTLGPSSHEDVQIAGSYGQHIILGVCSRSNGDPLMYECDVSVDGSYVATLKWLGDD